MRIHGGLAGAWCCGIVSVVLCSLLSTLGLAGAQADSETALSAAERPAEGFWNRFYHGFSFEEDLKPAFYLETVQPLYHDPDFNQTVFIQPRVNYDGTDDDYYNLGLGLRQYAAKPNALIGVNVFGDYQRDPGFGRVGVGGEWLGDVMDLRVNGYFRVGPRRRIEETATDVIYERVVNGLDAEGGIQVPYLPFAKVYGGGEFYDFKFGKNLAGWTGRLELKPFSFFTVNVRYADDNLSEGRWSTDARMSFDWGASEAETTPWVASEPWVRRDARARALDRVERRSKIVRERYSVSKVTGVTIQIGRSG